MPRRAVDANAPMRAPCGMDFSATTKEEHAVALMDVQSTQNSSSNRRLKPNSTRRLFDLSHGILFVTILLALVFLFVLSRDNIRQRTLQARLRSELGASVGGLAGPPQLQRGDIVPGFGSVDLVDGKPIHVLYDGRSKHLFFFMSLECDACLTELAVWNSLAQKTENKCTVLGVVIQPGSVTIPPVNFRLVSSPNLSLQRAYRVVEVPLVMVVSGNGIVEWVHYGHLNSDQVAELISVIEKKS